MTGDMRYTQMLFTIPPDLPLKREEPGPSEPQVPLRQVFKD